MVEQAASTLSSSTVSPVCTPGLGGSWVALPGSLDRVVCGVVETRAGQEGSCSISSWGC